MCKINKQTGGAGTKGTFQSRLVLRQKSDVVANMQGWTEVCHFVGERITLPHLDTTVWWPIIALCVTDLSYQNWGDIFVTLFICYIEIG